MNIPIYPGSSSFFPGNTPFGFYDLDYQFQVDADKVALFCARRLGYPIIDIELQDINFYAAFEEAITTYGNELYAFRVRDNYLTLEGASTSTTINDAIITPNLGNLIKVSEMYAAEAGAGGNVPWYKSAISASSGVQDYDLNEWAISQSYSNNDIEIKRIFWEQSPAIVRFFDPYAGTGTGMINLMDSFGWGGYSPAINFLIMPLSYDLQKIQAIEMNDMVRKSNFSFEMHNNVLRIFPIPRNDGKIWFEYILKSERTAGSIDANSGGNVSNVSNVPYTNPTYSEINSIGRQWIFEYTLALVKEILGYVRGKYTNIPIPNDNLTLNYGDLVTAATSEKIALVEKLRLFFDDTSRQKLLERRGAESDAMQTELNKIPFVIYCG